MTTREQRLRDLVEDMRAHSLCLEFMHRLEAILNEPVEVSDSMLRRACDAYDEHQASLEGYAIPMAMHTALTSALKEPGQ